MNLTKLEEELDKAIKRTAEVIQQESNLKFVIEKSRHGTDDEKRLIYLSAKLTIDQLNALIEDFKTKSWS